MAESLVRTLGDSHPAVRRYTGLGNELSTDHSNRFLPLDLVSSGCFLEEYHGESESTPPHVQLQFQWCSSARHCRVVRADILAVVLLRIDRVVPLTTLFEQRYIITRRLQHIKLPFSLDGSIQRQY